MAEPASVGSGGVARRRAIRSPQNFIAGAALVGLAAIAIWACADLGEGRFYAVGPALLPRAVATLLALIGAGLIARALIKEGEALGRWSLRGPLFIFIAVVAFALSIRTVGLAVAGPVVAVISGAASPETKPRENRFSAWVHVPA
jgi:putative tricarboxylic transport membrane protein